MHLLVALAIVVAAYFIGAIPFGYLVARSRGLNIFEHGSGNIGATNVGRVLGWRFGVLVFLLDFIKGAVPVLAATLAREFFTEPYWSRGFVEVAAGLTAFLGHLFPIYLKFQGGKGVAVGTGVAVVLLPIPMLAGFLVWAVVLCAWRYMSVASFAAIAALWAVQLRLTPSSDWLEPRTLFCLIAGGLVLVRHHANIGRLLKGTENQLKENVVMAQASKSLHVLALGLWFGMIVFFTFVVGLSLFGAFENLAAQEKRETWFPRPLMYDEVTDIVNGPKEQGTRAAGYAVGSIFSWYFALQGACGFIALATALAWGKFAGECRLHRWRINFLLVAVGLVLVGWPVEQRVSRKRIPRNQATEAHLRDPQSQTKAEAAQAARSEFGMWHGVSLSLNLATILCVTGAMALAGNLPARSVTQAAKPLSPDPTPISGEVYEGDTVDLNATSKEAK